jgi:hypothetical protein
MKREELLSEMRQCIGTQEPIVFFERMVDTLDLLFDQIDRLESDLNRVKIQSALSIHWEPRLASTMLANQINVLRQDKDTYFNELSALKDAFVEDKVTQSYEEFTKFWMDVLGWHPFLEYR